MKQYQTGRGQFFPHRRDDLRKGVEAQIGNYFDWTAAWIIEGGEYNGQWALIPTYDKYPGFSWVPECDVEFSK